MGFTKLDEHILQSSIMAEPPSTFKVWIAILASCGPDGVAEVSSIFLSSACHLSQAVVDKAIEALSNPDPRSRSLADDGRRIRRVDGGYFVINYEKYRGFSYSENPEAVRKRDYRKRVKSGGGLGHSGTCPGHSASASASGFDLLKEFLKTITAEDRSLLMTAFPACDLDVEFAKALAWVQANPAKGKKKNYRRFITNWLSRTQDGGGTHKQRGGAGGGVDLDAWARKGGK